MDVRLLAELSVGHMIAAVFPTLDAQRVNVLSVAITPASNLRQIPAISGAAAPPAQLTLHKLES